jgi:alpha/beta superfamily hydrolase
MPEVILPGAAGRIEGPLFSRQDAERAHRPDPASAPQGGRAYEQSGGGPLYHLFMTRGFATLRFNFRGVGRSQGEFDSGIGELADAATALDWLQAHNPRAPRPGSPAISSAPSSACSC